MTHQHVYRLPTTDGENPLPERAMGVCRCGATTEARLLWTTEDNQKFYSGGHSVRQQLRAIAQDYPDA